MHSQIETDILIGFDYNLELKNEYSYEGLIVLPELTVIKKCSRSTMKIVRAEKNTSSMERAIKIKAEVPVIDVSRHLNKLGLGQGW